MCALRSVCLSAMAIVAMIGLGVTSSSATTYTFDQEHCTGCSSGTYATATVSGLGTDSLTFDIITSTNVLIHDSAGGSGFGPGIYFDLTGASGALTFTELSGTFPPADWTGASGSVKGDAFGTGNFAAECSGPGSSKTCGSVIDFTVSDATTGGGLLNLASMTGSNGLGPMFLVGDFLAPANTTLCSGSTACTGWVGAPSAVPLPGAFVLFGSVLFGGFGVAKWRKRRARGPASVVA